MLGFIPLGKNKWPHDMLLSIDSRDPHALELLYVRHVWNLRSATDAVLGLDPEPTGDRSVRPATPGLDEWNRRWSSAWERHRGSYADDAAVQEPPSVEALRQNPELFDEWRASKPPTWRDEFGDEGFDVEAYFRWHANLPTELGLPLAKTPERISLDAAVHAWRRGLRTIIVLPSASPYAERLSRTRLMISAGSRNDPSTYRRALSLFSSWTNTTSPTSE
jgi:hypothetical protein